MRARNARNQHLHRQRQKVSVRNSIHPFHQSTTGREIGFDAKRLAKQCPLALAGTSCPPAFFCMCGLGCWACAQAAAESATSGDEQTAVIAILPLSQPMSSFSLFQDLHGAPTPPAHAQQAAVLRVSDSERKPHLAASRSTSELQAMAKLKKRMRVCEMMWKAGCCDALS